MIEHATLIPVLQSEVVVSDNPHVVLVTGLGSCVAACLFDPVARVGGMNHFLLPYGTARDGESGLQFGLQAMQALVRAVLEAGGTRQNLACKIFGGAAVVPLLDPIGEANTRLAKAYLAEAGISCVAKSVGGHSARRIRFWPTFGRVQHSFITDHNEMSRILDREEPLSAASEKLEYATVLQEKMRHDT